MTREEITQKVSQAVGTVLNRNVSEIVGDAMIVKDLGAESIDFLDISFEIENGIGFEVDFKEIIKGLQAKAGDQSRNDLTVNEIVDYIQAKSAE
jgi:acyl carrier protein